MTTLEEVIKFLRINNGTLVFFETKHNPGMHRFQMHARQAYIEKMWTHREVDQGGEEVVKRYLLEAAAELDQRIGS